MPENQAAMLQRVEERHSHGTRAAMGGLAVGSGDQRGVGYRVPVEWGSLPGELRGMGWISGFKRSSRAGFLVGYGAFACGVVGLHILVPLYSLLMLHSAYFILDFTFYFLQVFILHVSTVACTSLFVLVNFVVESSCIVTHSLRLCGPTECYVVLKKKNDRCEHNFCEDFECS